MIWTVIAINHNTEAVETAVFTLSHDGDKAEQAASKRLPEKTIIAMVKGNHGGSIYLPSKTFSLFRMEGTSNFAPME